MELSWELDASGSDIAGVVDGRAFTIESWAERAMLSFGGWGSGCVVRDRDVSAAVACDGWGSVDPAEDLVVFHGSSPVLDGPLTVVEESGEQSACVVVERSGRNVWFAFGRHDGSNKELIARRADGTEAVVAVLRAQTTDEWDRMVREFEGRHRRLREAASWRAGPLPDLGDGWDLVTVSPGEVNDESMQFIYAAFTFRRRDPTAFVHVHVDWFDGWPEFEPGGHFFDASSLSRSIHELGPVGLADDAAFDVWSDWVARQAGRFDGDDHVDVEEGAGAIAVTGSVVVDGVERVEHRWDLGSVTYSGIEWSDAISLEVIAAGVDLDAIIGSVREASVDEIDAFVASHPQEDENWNPDWWTER